MQEECLWDYIWCCLFDSGSPFGVRMSRTPLSS